MIKKPAAVCEVHLDQMEQGISNLHGYERALVVFRLRGSVVGREWIPVVKGRITAAVLREHTTQVAWPSWLVVNQDAGDGSPLPTASVVVCTRDRTEDLANCLPDLQLLAAQGHDVIVVDSCPSDGSSERLVASYPAIRYLHEPRPGLDIARNRGLQAARGEIVAFTDDDAQVGTGWLPALLRNFDDPMVAIVTGITMPLELETEAQLWFEETNGFGRGYIRRSFDSATANVLATGRIGAGVNMAIRRAVIDHIGLFDEALDGGTASRSGGDQEYFYRALSRGYRIVYEPAAPVWHRHRREWSALRQTFYGYGVGLFAWWTRCLLVEGEWSIVALAPRWFWRHHVRQVVRALLGRPKHVPLDLALAELRGALAGPGSYVQARRVLRSQIDPAAPERTHEPAPEAPPAREEDATITSVPVKEAV
ncbi:MAG TPA: glycosyltransferase [Roseiflexaceae bacterium]|nr:glycosyltransferase [Roseiflexaceae bacterium]